MILRHTPRRIGVYVCDTPDGAHSWPVVFRANNATLVTVSRESAHDTSLFPGYLRRVGLVIVSIISLFYWRLFARIAH